MVRIRQLQVEVARAEAQRADQRAERAAADERQRIAHELHDVVSHSVSVMVVQANAAEAVLGSEPERARESLLRIQDTGREAVVELKRLLGLLRSADEGLELAPIPSLSHIDVLLDQARQSGLQVSLELSGEPRTVPSSVDLAAYRIVQEALTNAIKHASHAHARVRIAYGNDAITVEVVDDGTGQDQGALGPSLGGHGLLGMRERAAVHGGRLSAGPGAQGGYVVRATLPL